MSDPTAPDADEALLAELRQVVGAHDPVPQALREASRAAFTWRTVDAELAALAFDSIMDDRSLAGVRSHGQPRLLTFETGDVAVEVEVHEERRRRRLVGQLVPPAPGHVEVRHGGGTSEAEVDDLGRFSVVDVVPGPVSLRCHVRGRIVSTDWTGL